MSYRTLGRHERLGAYVIEDKLGDGGMASVYLARAPNGGQVALKVADGVDRTHRARLFAEYETLSRLDHPSIVKVFDLGEEGSYVYYAMEYVSGPSLKFFVLAGQVVYAVAMRLFRQVLEAAAYLHGRSVMHRDIKPTNILIRRTDGRAVLIDFGISRSPERSEITSTGLYSGTLEYVSPEHARFMLGLTRERRYEPTARDDVYALGVVLYYLLTGQWPVPRYNDSPEGQLDFLRRLQHCAPLHPRAVTPHAPEAISELTLRMLEPRADLRPATAVEVLPAFLDAMKKDEDALLSPLPMVRMADVMVMQAKRAIERRSPPVESETILAPAIADESGDPFPGSDSTTVTDEALLVGSRSRSDERRRILAYSTLSAAVSAMLVLLLVVPKPGLRPKRIDAERALQAPYVVPDLPIPEAVLTNLPVIRGPVSPYQQRPPCPRASVEVRGACWIEFPLVGDDNSVRSQCERAPAAYMVSIEDCLKNRRIYRPATQELPSEHSR